MRDLNLQTLIGCVAERGPAWHRRDDLQGAEDNHYQGFIPLGDVTRRLFGWLPATVPVAYLVPCKVEDADFIRKDGVAVRVVESQQGRVGVLRDDNDYDMGVFKSDVKHPPYQVTLIERVETLIGTTLGISTAGLLAKGARAWVEMSMPETAHDDKSGLDYRPNFVAATSMDGSLAHTDALTVTATVCDNTLTWNLMEAQRAGRLYKRKHTSLSLDDMQEERDVLGILEQGDAVFTAGLHQLIEIELDKKKRMEVLDIIVPLPEEEGRAYTLAENKRSELLSLDSDPMVEPWVGTGWGEVQRFNTWQRWMANIKGTGYAERNTWRSLTGKIAADDREVVDAIQLVSA